MRYQELVLSFIKLAATFTAEMDLLFDFDFIVTPAPENVTFPAPACIRSIREPISKGTLSFIGIVTVTGNSLVSVTSLPTSSIARV